MKWYLLLYSYVILAAYEVNSTFDSYMCIMAFIVNIKEKTYSVINNILNQLSLRHSQNAKQNIFCDIQ